MAGGYVDGMLAREQQTSTFLAMVLRFPMAQQTRAIRC
ncbi:hypothetical protein SEEK9263_06519 [Salmonella enterica subsp. enterica serovar Kentucky str. ATCC 9263]|nr:hypothetical protein SEEK9263_06519 [Salmonella enterica subsp. enterica serovar Kentucky str. ATCC 9263]